MRLEGAQNQEAPSKLTWITRYHWLTQVLEDIVIWDWRYSHSIWDWQKSPEETAAKGAMRGKDSQPGRRVRAHPLNWKMGNIIPYTLVVFSRSWLAFGYNVIFYMFHAKMFISGYRQFVLNTAQCSFHFGICHISFNKLNRNFSCYFFKWDVKTFVCWSRGHHVVGNVPRALGK